MSRTLDRVKIAYRCPASWDEMSGTERVRFCEQCGLHVYNLSGMTQPEAEAIVRETEGRTCLRFYRRADGTLLTQNCPVGWRALRRKVALIVGLAAATAIYILSHAVTPLRGTRGPDEEAHARHRNWTLTSVLDLLDPVPPFEPKPQPQPPCVMGW